MRFGVETIRYFWEVEEFSGGFTILSRERQIVVNYISVGLLYLIIVKYRLSQSSRQEFRPLPTQDDQLV